MRCKNLENKADWKKPGRKKLSESRSMKDIKIVVIIAKTMKIQKHKGFKNTNNSKK